MANQPARYGSGIQQLIGDNREALIRYARLADAGEAIEIARGLLAEGWTEIPGPFANLIAHLHAEAPDRWLDLANEVFEAVRREEIGEKTTPAIHTLTAFEDQDKLRGQVAEFLAARAQPGDARLVIDVFRHAIRRADGERHASARSWATPLAVWLVQKGGAELRRAEGAIPVVLLHVIDLLRREASDQLVSALDLLATSEQPQAAVLHDEPGERILFPAIEDALARGLPQQWVEELLGGAFAILQAIGPKRFFVAFDPAGPYPRLGAALHAALAHAKWNGGAGYHAWMLAFEHAPREPMPFTDAGLEAAFEALMWARTEIEHFPGRRIEAWAEALTTAWFERFGLTRPRPGMLGRAWSPDVLAFETALAPGIAKALQRRLAGEPLRPDLEVARQLSEQASRDPRLASVALLTLPEMSSSDGEPDHGLTVEAVAEYLTSIVRHGWDRPIAGIDVVHLFRDARKVRIDDLPSEFAIDFQGDRIVSANARTYRQMWAKCTTRDDALAISALYFVHEVIHVYQGIQRKELVTSLRANASEPTLADLDLAADDLAARIVAAGTEWSLAWLKNLEGKATEAFPASLHHTGASVARKSSRLVGLRIDGLLRGNVLGPVNVDGYASVVLPFSDGEMQVMWNARIARLIGTIKLDANEAQTLRTAARPDCPRGELDMLLIDVIRRFKAVEGVDLYGL
jgi:hypothetical protein